MRRSDLAHDLARKLLESPLPRRWAHTQGVAAQANTLAPILGDDDADFLITAAWLHDIGYSPDLVDTGFHPLDGARYLGDLEDIDDELCRLVAHHSCAIVEAQERGIADVLMREFPFPRRDLLDALTYCDMTTSPDGTRVTVEERVAEIRNRYGRNRSIERSVPSLVRVVNQVEAARKTWSHGANILSPSFTN